MNKGLFILSLLAFTGCNELIGERGNDERVTKEITLDSFDKIDISGAFYVTLTPSNSNILTIESDENLLRYIDISVQGNRLFIHHSGRGWTLLL